MREFEPPTEDVVESVLNTKDIVKILEQFHKGEIGREAFVNDITNLLEKHETYVSEKNEDREIDWSGAV